MNTSHSNGSFKAKNRGKQKLNKIYIRFIHDLNYEILQDDSNGMLCMIMQTILAGFVIIMTMMMWRCNQIVMIKRVAII